MKYVYENKVKEISSVIDFADYILSDRNYVRQSFTLAELLAMGFEKGLPVILETIFTSDNVTTVINKEHIKLNVIEYLFVMKGKTDEERLEDLQKRGIYCSIDELHYIQENFEEMAKL